MFLCFCPFRALLFQYNSQGVASLALGYDQVALSGRCSGLKAQRAHRDVLAIWCQQFQLVSDTNQFVPFFLELCFHVTSNYIYMLGLSS